jgi:hypothetical protein
MFKRNVKEKYLIYLSLNKFIKEGTVSLTQKNKSLPVLLIIMYSLEKLINVNSPKQFIRLFLICSKSIVLLLRNLL